MKKLNSSFPSANVSSSIKITFSAVLRAIDKTYYYLGYCFLVAMSFDSTAFGNMVFLVTVGAKTTILVAAIDSFVTFFVVTVIAFESRCFTHVQYRTADISLDFHSLVTLKINQVSLDFIEALGLRTEFDQCHECLIRLWESLQNHCD